MYKHISGKEKLAEIILNFLYIYLQRPKVTSINLVMSD